MYIYWVQSVDDTWLKVESNVEMTEEHFKTFDESLMAEGFDGQTYLKSFLENPSSDYLARKQKYDNEQTIQECQAYLDETDYVITKLNELKLEDEDEYETEKTKYADILTKRKECRKKINELQEGE